jgi:hypothetical protein
MVAKKEKVPKKFPLQKSAYAKPQNISTPGIVLENHPAIGPTCLFSPWAFLTLVDSTDSQRFK